MRRFASFVGSIAVIFTSMVLTSTAANASYPCTDYVTSGSYAIRACIEVDQYAARGYLYVTLWQSHQACTIRGKYIYDTYDPPHSGAATNWACPAGAVTNTRYELDPTLGPGIFTRGAIIFGTQSITAESGSVSTCHIRC